MRSHFTLTRTRHHTRRIPGVPASQRGCRLSGLLYVAGHRGDGWHRRCARVVRCSPWAILHFIPEGGLGQSRIRVRVRRASHPPAREYPMFCFVFWPPDPDPRRACAAHGGDAWSGGRCGGGPRECAGWRAGAAEMEGKCPLHPPLGMGGGLAENHVLR
jgi:hypothetical protein